MLEQQTSSGVIPAKAGVQFPLALAAELDSGLRRNDDERIGAKVKAA